MILNVSQDIDCGEFWLYFLIFDSHMLVYCHSIKWVDGALTL